MPGGSNPHARRDWQTACNLPTWPRARGIGVLSTHYDRPCRPDERDLDVIDHIGGRTAYWLDRTLHALASD
jgi:hypothetical protein